MKKINAIILILLMSYTSFCQYQPGYFIDMRGDTIKGIINFRRSDLTPRNILFKSSENSDKVSFSSKEISAFWANGEFYISAITQIDRSEIKIMSELTESPVPELQTDTVFLRVLYSADKSLLYLKDGKGKIHFFIREKGRKIEPLIYKKYSKLILDMTLPGMMKRVILENEQYQKQLYLLFSDCVGIQKEIENSGYTVSELVKLFRSYSQCINQPIEQKKEFKEAKINFGVIVGANTSILKFYGDGIAYFRALEQTDFNFSTRPFLGISMEAFSLKSGLGYASDLLYTSFSVSGECPDPNIASSLSFSFQYLKTHQLLRFMPSKQNSGFYIMVGGSLGIMLKDTSQPHNTILNGSSIYANLTTGNVNFGYITGLGWLFKRISLEARYESTSGVSGLSNLNSKLKGLQLLVRIPLFIKSN
jgi:hypothetical protein